MRRTAAEAAAAMRAATAGEGGSSSVCVCVCMCVYVCATDSTAVKPGGAFLQRVSRQRSRILHLCDSFRMMRRARQRRLEAAWTTVTSWWLSSRRRWLRWGWAYGRVLRVFFACVRAVRARTHCARACLWSATPKLWRGLDIIFTVIYSLLCFDLSKRG